ncbi:MAG: hypothetical protein IPJ41_01970 [Phycisphaerales bacterium]|nr:hypothetical protein [Phycisphaerales bacterium]
MRPKCWSWGQFKGGKVEGHAADKLFAEALARGEATGDVGRIVEVFPQTGARGKGPSRTMIVGLGDKASCNAETFRTIAGAIGRRLAQTRETRVEIDLAGACKAAGMDIQRAGCALGEVRPDRLELRPVPRLGHAEEHRDGGWRSGPRTSTSRPVSNGASRRPDEPPTSPDR